MNIGGASPLIFKLYFSPKRVNQPPRRLADMLTYLVHVPKRRCHRTHPQLRVTFMTPLPLPSHPRLTELTSPHLCATVTPFYYYSYASEMAAFFLFARVGGGGGGLGRDSGMANGMCMPPPPPLRQEERKRERKEGIASAARKFYSLRSPDE